MAFFSIGGLHPLTAIDFPGHASALVFTQGCNFHCPYCHNKGLVPLAAEARDRPDVDEVLAFLQKRRGLLSGVVISGGEPCIQEGLRDFCREVKGMGFALKLDTNGSHPEVLANLLAEGLLEYVAMDVKAPLASAPLEGSAYSPGLCGADAIAALGQSMALLSATHVAHEFRTTCVEPFVTADNLVLIAETVAQHCPGTKPFPWYLQKAVLPGGNGPDSPLRPLPPEAMHRALPRLGSIVPGVRIRE